MPLPKVLILGQPFTRNTGGGITLSNLFSGWERDRIAVACSAYLFQNDIETDICNTYYQLGCKERKWIFPLSLFARKYYSGLIESDEQKKFNSTIVKSKGRVKMIMNYFYPILNFFGVLYGISKTRLSREFCNWLDEYKPDVIYAQATSRENVLFCTLVQSYLKKPFVFHMMDDWPSTIAGKGFFKTFWQKKIDAEFRKLLNGAAILLSISDQMAYEYKRRYNKSFITFHNPIDFEFWKKYQKKDYTLSLSPTILYAGRIGMGIDGSLEIIANAIQKLNKEFRLAAKFILQTNEKPAWANKYSCIEHRAFIAYDDLPKVFAEADFLILPYDFSPKALRFIKYSMPTKATEYMISGTPIIVFAPEGTAIVEYAKKYNWAKIITNMKTDELFKAVEDLIQNETTRKEIAQNAKRVAIKNHDSVNVRDNFRNILTSLVLEK
jgi:glycosyltransferase involved in cell wall biosynthesis